MPAKHLTKLDKAKKGCYIRKPNHFKGFFSPHKAVMLPQTSTVNTIIWKMHTNTKTGIICVLLYKERHEEHCGRNPETSFTNLDKMVRICLENHSTNGEKYGILFFFITGCIGRIPPYRCSQHVSHAFILGINKAKQCTVPTTGDKSKIAFRLSNTFT